MLAPVRFSECIMIYEINGHYQISLAVLQLEHPVLSWG